MFTNLIEIGVKTYFFVKKKNSRKMRESFHRSVFRLQQQVDVKQDDSNRQAAEVETIIFV